MALGLVTTSQLVPYRSLTNRRKVFLQYPTGAAPLMGLLSYLPTEYTDKSQDFGWYEKRFPIQYTTTAASGTAPFRVSADLTALPDLTALIQNQQYALKVVSTAEIKPTHVLELREITLNNVTTSYVNIRAVVTEVVDSTTVRFRPLSTIGSAGAGPDNNTTDNNGKTVMIIGTANAENQRSGIGITTYPVNPTNNTQIFRSAFNVSRTALKMGLAYDETGEYKTLAWDNGLRHMIEMEKATLFGQKALNYVNDPETGEQVPETTMGGVQYYLEQWEAANSIYRGGTGASALTLNTDPQKRIIDLGGTLSKVDYNTYISRAFKFTNDKAYEKLCLCGGQFLETVNALFERDVTRQTLLQEKGRNWEFMVHTHTTLRGTVHYVVHPLLDIDPDYTDGAFILDLGNIKVRPLTDSDTKFLKNRQERDRDGRKDEWLTEMGMELRFPESHMILKNATRAA